MSSRLLILSWQRMRWSAVACTVARMAMARTALATTAMLMLSFGLPWGALVGSDLDGQGSDQQGSDQQGSDGQGSDQQGSEAAYTAWSQGRPDEALSMLHQQAQSSQRWDHYLDLGLAAAAAEQPGRAAVWLLEAHRLAPAMAEPRAALNALHAQINIDHMDASQPLPLGWSGHLGPLATPGSGWWTPPLLAVASALLAAGLVRFLQGWRSPISQPASPVIAETAGPSQAARPGRPRWLIVGAGLVYLLTLPGWIATLHDQAQPYVAIAKAVHLVDSTGNPIASTDAALRPGHIVLKEPRAAWDSRILVRTLDGTRGWIPQSTVSATP